LTVKDGGIAAPVLLGLPAEIEAAAGRAGVSLAGIATLDPERSDRLKDYAELYASGRPGSAKVAGRLVRKPEFFGHQFGRHRRSGTLDSAARGLQRLQVALPSHELSFSGRLPSQSFEDGLTQQSHAFTGLRRYPDFCAFLPVHGATRCRRYIYLIEYK
jgi:hypothetical protein